MTDATAAGRRNEMKKHLATRYRKETIFRYSGLGAVVFAVSCLGFLLFDIFSNGYAALWQHGVEIEVSHDPGLLGVSGPDDLDMANYPAVIKAALAAQFPDVRDRRGQRELQRLISSGAEYRLRDRLLADPQLLGKTETVRLLLDDDVDSWFKETDLQAQADSGRLSTAQKGWLQQLAAAGKIQRQFNGDFFRAGDSREPEQAGIYGAMIGSALTLLVTLVLSFPIGVGAAIYLEEFAPANRWTEFIEININNLAAVPSIIYGLLGLAIFLNMAGLPRSVPLVGGLVLTLMSLPTIIISSRVAIKAVPPSLKEAALGLGASQMQMVFHHVLPAAMPGMLTGTIIAMARALGETAPLLMIGMVAFIADIPGGITDAATVLPVQIYLWADSPERAFVALTSAAIMVLLVFLVTMNAVAIILRKRLERRW